jgi:hypothetical protein
VYDVIVQACINGMPSGTIMPDQRHPGLTASQVQQFIDDGFIRIENAFSPELAARCRQELWADIGLSPDQPEDWRQPVIRVAGKCSSPFVEAANTPTLQAAYDDLVGAGRWVAPRGLGTFPIRFPSTEPPGDDGWHVDMSFGDSADFLDWRVNVRSRGRALLMLFLLSDVAAADAPTRIRRGSHRIVARELLPHGEAGLSLRQLSADGYASSAGCDVELATGTAGTAFLCHPFLVHAAQRHHGSAPRFLAQPPLVPKGEFDPVLPPSPVQIAIRQACGLEF